MSTMTQVRYLLQDQRLERQLLTWTWFLYKSLDLATSKAAVMVDSTNVHLFQFQSSTPMLNMTPRTFSSTPTLLEAICTTTSPWSVWTGMWTTPRTPTSHQSAFRTGPRSSPARGATSPAGARTASRGALTNRSSKRLTSQSSATRGESYSFYILLDWKKRLFCEVNCDQLPLKIKVLDANPCILLANKRL